MAITDPRIDSAVLDGRTLTPAEVDAVARRGRHVRLDEGARSRNLRAADAIAQLVERGTPIYGVTTGVGALRSREVPPSERPGHQLRLLRSHACGAGPALSVDRVRAAMVVRANQLGAGGAGVSDELLGALVDALNAGFVPFTREFGSLGTGDLTVLADIALSLLGEGRAWRGERLVAAESALAEAGLSAPGLGPRDGIAFMSSNAASIGHAALVAVDADRLLKASLGVAALSFLAAGADPMVLDPRVQAARGHPGQVAIAERMQKLLGPDLGTAVAGRDSRPAVHDPYPFRAFAQVKGGELDALRELEAILAVELNAAGENALVDPEPPEALPTANFHAGVLALGLDRLRAGLAQAASLGASRVSALLDPGLMGLPAALAARPGQDSGAMIVEYTAHAAAADVRLRAGPVAAQTTSVGGGLESHASFAPFAARATQEALDSAALAVSAELVVAVRALRLRGLAPAAGDAGDLFAAAVERTDDDLRDRPLSDDLEAARRLLLGEEGIDGRA
jgi:histidine ammonia-lyase